MSASDFWAPPADSADLESYSAITLRRAPQPAVGSAVPPREAYSRKCPGVSFGDVGVLSLDQERGSIWDIPICFGSAPRARPQARSSHFDFLSGPQFVCLMSTPAFAFALVWLMGLL